MTLTKMQLKRKPTSKSKPTQHIMWRGKLITIFGKNITAAHQHYIVALLISFVLESRVYKLIAKIPMGKVSTYGIVAQVLRSGPRCVGQALRKNPFAPGIPCHRIVAATLDIGGFQGATGEASPFIKKKRKLLAKEGVLFTNDNKIDPICLYEFNQAAD